MFVLFILFQIFLLFGCVLNTAKKEGVWPSDDILCQGVVALTCFLCAGRDLHIVKEVQRKQIKHWSLKTYVQILSVSLTSCGSGQVA